MRKKITFTSALLGLACLVATGAQAEMTDPVIDRIKANNVLSIGYRETSIPFSYLDADQKPVGYSTDICLELAETVRRQLDLPDLDINWVPVNLQNRIPLVANGTVDISCESAVNTIGRQSQVDFSNPFFVSHTRLLVKSDSGVTELEDLVGERIALPMNSTPEKLIKSIIERDQLDIDIVSVKDNAEGFLMLSTGRADAYATDDILLFGLQGKAPDPSEYAVVGQALSHDSYGLLVQKNSTVFLTLVNATLARLSREGKLETLYDKWFTPMGIPLADDLRTSFALQAIPE
ncbi:amino acid ABC transporter substrate-binding protein [Salipiger sp. 1_MG-2023]|uniref:amino acid ABC transporter substrate-binding protein n=1 Tax=Salipiger sp. 1_MG-2023 TaxID=3062665 RepID=UPI0026E4405D|nr:amino acid ABC transporter substrate-binding protein [Salipiger sp. 1_MG-2023]MDO6585138.1 amino acid ABC transporter substrate-binding protein [Salipiger sp. 1_MG-2023]